MLILQVFLALVAFFIVMGLVTVLAAFFGLRRAVKNLNRDAARGGPRSATAREAEAGRVVFEAKPCPHCGTYLSEPPESGKCPACGQPV
jgi:hypothetical protein